MPFDVDAIKSHIFEECFRALVDVEPFPRLVVDNIFPADFYEHFVKKIPPRDDFATYIPGTDRNKETTFRLYAEDFAKISNEHTEIDALLEILFPYISQLVSTKLSPFFPAMFCQIFPEEWQKRIGRAKVKFSLSRSYLDRTHLWSQAPHTDASYRIGAWLLYLPTEEPLLPTGTDIYEVEAFQKEYDPLETYFSAAPQNCGLKRHSTVKFLPNRLVAFLNSPTSFHGYSLPENAGVDYPLRRITMNNWIEFERSSYIDIFGDVPSHFFDLHYDTIWKPDRA